MSHLAKIVIEKEKNERTGRLDLGRCGLKDIPEEVFELTWLEELSFCDEFLDLTKSKWMNSSNTGPKNHINVKELPIRFKALIRLKRFFFGGTFRKHWNSNKCDILADLEELQYLYIGFNKISDINFLEKLTGLQSLCLINNKISDISILEKLTGLQSLYLSGNQISDISILEKLTGLQSLDLIANQISDISPLLPLI